jgi:probable phosphoglycerate mutase
MEGKPEWTVYLVRHAEPALPDNIPRFIGAKSDPPLSANGLLQAQRLAQTFQTLNFDKVWSSDLARSLRTAELASRLPTAAIRVDVGLREIDLGLWDGLTVAEVRTHFPGEWAEREADIIGFRFPQGERFLDLQRRAVRVMRSIATALSRQAGGHALVVAHKNFNRSFLCHLLGRPLEQMFELPQDHCSVSTLRLSKDSRGTPRFQLVRSSFWTSGQKPQT